MLLLIGDDLSDGSGGTRINRLQLSNLRRKMTQHHAFDCNGCRGNGLAPNDSGQGSQSQPANAAKVETPATSNVSSGHFGREQVTMPAFVLQGLIKLVHHRR